MPWINSTGQLGQLNTESMGRTLWVPGQVVGDGIQEELSCLLPLIVKLLLVIGRATHTMRCYWNPSVTVKPQLYGRRWRGALTL